MEDHGSSVAKADSGDAKHTPGPWEVRFRFGRRTTVSGRQRFPICDTGTAPLGEANHGREEANALLIAAAPELLALARSLKRWLMADAEPSHVGRDDMRVYHLDGGVLSNLLNEARAAILKATGERS